MARTKSNSIKMTQVKKQAKTLDKMETIQSSVPEFDGQDIHFYPVFKETILSQLLDELQEKTIYAHENEINMNDRMLYEYSHLLAIKYFTHLGKDMPDDLAGQLDAMKWLMDTLLYKELTEEILPKKELAKIWEAVTDFLAKVQFTEKLANDVQKKFELLDLENADVIKNAFKNSKVKFKDDKDSVKDQNEYDANASYRNVLANKDDDNGVVQ